MERALNYAAGVVVFFKATSLHAKGSALALERGERLLGREGHL